ncbi:hypothetical protein HPP92_005348 [Vanilla planifolia]|uniref:Uncharacterized protein n=1 Tax=Vanilla planifolia TaxID=51239 RepID=A0A835VCJ2_VANPL|nr:hypothetical protein HPP92_005348 [Vanilla planifolia]
MLATKFKKKMPKSGSTPTIEKAMYNLENSEASMSRVVGNHAARSTQLPTLTAAVTRSKRPPTTRSSF